MKKIFFDSVKIRKVNICFRRLANLVFKGRL